MVREKLFEWKNWKGMIHTTWNPQAPGVIRIHMIPPKFHLFRFIPSIVILNGNQILPLNESWAILITVFIQELNKRGERELEEAEGKEIIEDTLSRMRKIFPHVPLENFQEDLEFIAEVFEDIARGRIPKVDIGQMTIGEYALHMTAPHRMDLMMSAMEKEGKWNCNQRCVHCYAAGQNYANVKELDTEHWKKIIEICKQNRIPQLTFTGGEPTMREDLPGLIKESRWFITRLNTNGVKLTEEYCQKLREAELDNVQITFYSSDAQIHNSLTGASYYEKTVEGIKNALAAGLSVNINTPLCSQNADYVTTLKFLKSLGVTYVTCSGLIPAGNAVKEDSLSIRLGKEEIRQVVSEGAAYCAEHGMEMSFTSPGWIEEEELKKMGLEVPSCGAALSNMAIAPDGTVVACQSCLNRENFGNILREDWKKIWNHPECKKYREFSSKMYQECPLGREKRHG